MNQGHIGQRIDRLYGTLSRQEQRVADVILDHFHDLAVYTASELAQLAGVSKATVSRLFRRLGYDDFAQAKAHARTLRDLGSPLGGGKPTATGSTALDLMLAAEQRNLDRLAETLRTGGIDGPAQLLAHASRLVVLGRRNSYPVALHLRQQMAQVRGNVHLLPPPGQSLGEDLVDLGPRDAAVVVGFRRRPKGFAQLLRALEAAQASVILIGDESLNEEHYNVAHLLRVSLDVPSSFDSYASAMSLVNLLVTATLAVQTRQGRLRISKITSLYDELEELEHPW